MSFTDDLDPKAVTDITNEYKKAAFWLPFSAAQLDDVFTDDEIEEVSQLVKEVQDAGTSNKKKAAAVAKYSAVTLKLLKMAKILV